jgi:hypothetical protein
MRERTYAIITNVSVAIGVGALLLLGRFGSLQVPLIVLSLASCAVALGVHFYAEWHPSTEQARRAKCPSAPTEVFVGAPATLESDGIIERHLQDDALDDVREFWPNERLESQRLGSYLRSVGLFVNVVPAVPPRLAIDDMVAVAKRLAPGCTGFSVTWKPDGSVTIAPVETSSGLERLIAAQQQELELRDDLPDLPVACVN